MLPLPVLARPAPAIARQPSRYGTPVLAPAAGTVLLIEPGAGDDSTLWSSLREEFLLQRAVGTAEALRLAGETRPDAVVVAGCESAAERASLCERLRAHAALAGIPLVVVGCRSDEEFALLSGGVSDFVLAPVQPQVLRLRVRNQIGLRRLHSHLSFLAGTDPLTGLANRRSLDDALRREMWRLRRSSAPLSLLMVDIDHFKDCNDRFGHSYGDVCLRTVASVLGDELSRAPDLAARYGGEEFCGILPETDLAGALAVAERIRGRIASLDIPEPERGQSHRVSVSVGVVAANCSQVDSSTQLLALADDCLYRAKRAGRNRVVSCVHGLAAAAGPMQ